MNEIRTAMLILVGLFITSSVFAVEPLDLKLDNNWKRTSLWVAVASGFAVFGVFLSRKSRRGIA